MSHQDWTVGAPLHAIGSQNYDELAPAARPDGCPHSDRADQAACLLTLAIDALSVELIPDANFAFEAVQTWELNETVEPGYGYSMPVLTAEYPAPPRPALPQQAALSLEMDSATGVTSAILIDREHPLLGCGGGGGASSTERFTSELYYLEPLPEGPLTIRVVGFSAREAGPRNATCAPPE